MAALGPGPVASGDVARALGETAQQLSQIRQRLIDKGVVVAAGRELDFSLPGLRAYVIATAGPAAPSRGVLPKPPAALPPGTLADAAYPTGINENPTPQPPPPTRTPPGDPPQQARHRRPSR